MVDKRLRRRTPVRIKQIRGVADELASWIGHEVSLDGFLEQAHYQETDLILVDRVPLATVSYTHLTLPTKRIV